MTGSNVHAGSRAKIVIGQLGDHRVRPFNGEHIKEGRIAFLCNSSDLQSCQNCIPFIKSRRDVPCHLHVEQKGKGVFTRLPPVVVQSIGDPSNVESGSCVDCTAGRRRCVPGTRERAGKGDTNTRLDQQRQTVSG